MRNENGTDAGVRNIGRFFLALIPWALGIGALAWISFAVAIHEFNDEVDAARRRNTYVGASQLPASKLKIEARKPNCITITRADVDGPSLTIYAQASKSCVGLGTPNYTDWHWQTLSPDNTLLHSGDTNLCVDLDPGDKGECRMTIDTDARDATVRVWVTR